MADRARAAVAGLVVALVLDSLAWGFTVRVHLAQMVPGVLALPLLFFAFGLAREERTSRGWGAPATCLFGASALAAGATVPWMGVGTASPWAALQVAVPSLVGSAAVLYSGGRSLGAAGAPVGTLDLFWTLLGCLAGLGLGLPVRSAAGIEGEALLATGLLALLAPSPLSRWGSLAVALLCTLGLAAAGRPPWQGPGGRRWARDGLTEVIPAGADGCRRVLRDGLENAYGCEPPTPMQEWKERAVEDLSSLAGGMLWIDEAGPIVQPRVPRSTTRVGLSEARQVLGIPPGYGRRSESVNERDQRAARELENEDKGIARRMPKFGLILVDGLGNHVSRVPGSPFEEDCFLMTPYALEMMVRGGLVEGGAIVAFTYGDKPLAAAALVEGMREKNPLAIYRLPFEKEGKDATSVLVSIVAASQEAIARLAARLAAKGLLEGDLIASGPRSGSWFSGGSSGILPRAGSLHFVVSEPERVEAPASPIALSLTEENPLPIDLLPRFFCENLPWVLCVTLLQGWRASRWNGGRRSERARLVAVGALGASLFLLLAVSPGRRLLWEPAEGAHLLWALFLAGACLGLAASTRTGPVARRILSAVLGILILLLGGGIGHDPLGDGPSLAFGLAAGFLSAIQVPPECREGAPYGLLAGIPIGVLAYELAVALVGVVCVAIVLFLAYFVVLSLGPPWRSRRMRGGDPSGARSASPEPAHD